MKRLLVLLAILVMLPIGLAQEEITDTVCSIEKPCSEELECFNFEGIGLRCAQPDPCSYFECAEGEECVIGTTRPLTVACGVSEEFKCWRVENNKCVEIESCPKSCEILENCYLTLNDCNSNLKVVAKEPVEESAGIGPESIFYGLDLAFEKLQLALASNEVKRAKLHLKFASERIAELKDVDKEEARERAVVLYEEGMDKAVTAAETAKNTGQDVSEIVQQIDVNMAKHVEVLEIVKAQVPEEAKVSIEQNINRSRERIGVLKAEAAETGTNIIARSDVIVGDVIKEINKGYEELNPAYETTNGSS